MFASEKARVQVERILEYARSFGIATTSTGASDELPVARGASMQHRRTVSKPRPSSRAASSTELGQ